MRFALPAFLLAILVCPLAVQAETLRYAVIIGNNSSGGTSVPPLKHAEAEARKLHGALLKYGRFHPSRLIVLTNPSRDHVSRAISRLAEQRLRDQRTFPGSRSVFAFFFTGHGKRGELIVGDGPLTGPMLRGYFQRMDATFSIGFFDACNSGSLAMSAKGLKPGRRSPLASIPADLLNAKGRLWYASSQADELSFEDPKLGGVFTHFFIEALRRADVRGPVSIEALYKYARDHTVLRTQRQQHPFMKGDFEGGDFPLFSFPASRPVKLVVSSLVEGPLLLSYAEGRLVTQLDKTRGRESVAWVHAGRAELVQVRGERVVRRRELNLRPGTVVVRHLGDAPRRAPLGRRETPLWTKGGPDDEPLAASHIGAGLTLSLGVQYGFQPQSAGLSVQHLAVAGLRMDRGAVYVELLAGYGYGSRDYESWGWTAHSANLGLNVGYAFDVGATRIGVGGCVRGHVLFQRYRNQSERERLGVDTGACGQVIWPQSSAVAGVLTVGGGGALVPSDAETGGEGAGWTGWFNAALGIEVRVY